MQDQTKTANPGEPTLPDRAKDVKFINEKPAYYRIFHSDGTWGTINAHGNVLVDFFVERPPTPSAVIQPVLPDGNFTGEQKMQGLEDPDHFIVVREFQCGIVMSLNAAIQLNSVLESYIKTTKQQLAGAMAQTNKPQ